jgi:hypothetical protein
MLECKQSNKRECAIPAFAETTNRRWLFGVPGTYNNGQELDFQYLLL